ncbi:MAG: EAL domain-containing protein, partial [Gammaproteobacteria bacterium]|nr:EAL domain-containing protein [Gammaproteobacteria bacterium]
MVQPNSSHTDLAYIEIMNSLGEGVIITNSDGTITFANAQAEQQLLWKAGELVTRPIEDIINVQGGCDHPLESGTSRCGICRTLNDQEVYRESDAVFNTSTGQLLPVSFVTSPIIIDDEMKGMTIAFHDISERKKSEAELKLQSTALASAANAIFITNRNGEIEWVNRAFEEMTGYNAEEAIGNNPRMLNSAHHPKTFFSDIWETLLAGKVWRGEVIERHKNGERYTVEQTLTPIIEGDKVTHFVAIHEDISERKWAEEKIRKLALYDSLTGLPNRDVLRDRLTQACAVAQRAETLIAVMFLDLDHFKDVNDTMGHDAGDRLLQEVAKRLQGCIRASDTVTRFGGDEFVIIQTGLKHIEDAATMAQKINQSIARPFMINGHEIHTGTSIGITITPFDDDDIDTLLKHADMAMYQAKSNGRNHFQFFDMAMHHDVQERTSMEALLRSAIREQQFHLVYQPQILASTGEVVGMEALIRWEHPERGVISPVEFIPVAESCGLIHAIGEFVLYTACQQAKQWQQEGLEGLRVGVNLSVQQLKEADLVANIARILDETGLDGEYLELELTESMLMSDVEYTRQIFRELRDMGVNLAIDDFGTGYSSLSYLSQLPVQRIKIDQSFVHDIDSNPDSLAIASAVINLGHSLGLNVLAEGVEAEDHVTCLQELNCD